MRGVTFAYVPMGNCSRISMLEEYEVVDPNATHFQNGFVLPEWWILYIFGIQLRDMLFPSFPEFKLERHVTLRPRSCCFLKITLHRWPPTHLLQQLTNQRLPWAGIHLLEAIRTFHSRSAVPKSSWTLCPASMVHFGCSLSRLRDNSGSDTSLDAGLCAGKADEFVAGETYSFAWSTHGAVFSFESETSIWLPFCFLLPVYF